MKISHLELVHFRNMQSAKISFQDRDFVALIGDNGSGKTCILEAITKAFVPVLRTVNSEAMKERDLTNGDIQCGMKSVAVTIDVSLDGDSYRLTNKRRLSAQMPFEDSIVQNELSRKGIKELKIKYAECIEKRQLPLVLYYGTDRIIREVPKRGHIKNFEVTDALRNCFDNVNYFRDFYDWFKTEEDMELRGLRKDPHYKNYKLDSVRMALERMIKGYTNLRIELSPSRMLLTDSKGVNLQVDQLSGGYKAVLSVVADIAKRMALAYPDSVNPIEEEAIILIDELDLHLHPRWQKTIAEDLKRTFPRCQFIVSTHSPFIIQSLSAEELFDIHTMKYAAETGSFKGWSIDTIQEEKMGVEPRTVLFNKYMNDFSVAIDCGKYDLAKELYRELRRMINPRSHERRILDLDMEMMEADDKA